MPERRLALTERLAAAQECARLLVEENRRLSEENQQLRRARSRAIARGM